MSELKAATLYSYSSDESVTLEETIKNCDQVLKGAIALLYSPQSCQFLKLSNEKFHNIEGEVNDLSDFFEARIFTEQCELRWLNRNDGHGDAVLLSDSEQSIEKFKPPDSKYCETLEQRYLLWGKAVKRLDKSSGWQRLAEARIGKLDIPFDKELFKDHQRVYLKTCEYLDEVDNYGNFGVIEERLVRLEV